VAGYFDDEVRLKCRLPRLSIEKIGAEERESGEVSELEQTVESRREVVGSQGHRGDADRVVGFDDDLRFDQKLALLERFQPGFVKE
jgi:hypothetical protein